MAWELIMPECPICGESISWRERLDMDRNLIGDHFKRAHQEYVFEYFALMVPLNFFSIGLLVNSFIVSLHWLGIVTLRPLSYAQFLLVDYEC